MYALAGLGIFVLLFADYAHLYDLPTGYFFALALALIYRGRLCAYLVLFFPASLNRETAILLTGVFALYAWRRLKRGNWYLHIAAQALIFSGVQFVIRHYYFGMAGGAVWFTSGENIAAYAARPLETLLYLVILFWLACRREPDFLRLAFAVLTPPILLSSLFFGGAFERRTLIEMYPAAFALLYYNHLVNFHQLKQWLFNNLTHGENTRAERLAEHLFGRNFQQRSLILASVMPNTARVWGVDISHWNLPPVNLKRMADNYAMKFVFIKGCDGSLNTKYYFEHVAAAKLAGVPWGMYVWLYPNGNVSIDAQVNAWTTRAQIDPPPLGIAIDAEWTSYGGLPANPSAADLRGAHDKIKARYGKAAITYTAAGYANVYLKGFDWMREDLWIANYGVNNPMLPTGANKYVLWQFTSTLDGKFLDPNGNAELDGNYFNGTAEEFQAKYNLTIPPPVNEDVVSFPFNGVQRVSGVRHNWKFELFISDPSKVTYETVCTLSLEIPSSVSARNGAQVFGNGGDWNRVSLYDYAVSNGGVCHPSAGVGRPSLMVLDDGKVIIDQKPAANVRQALSGLRFLIRGGMINPDVYRTDKAEWTEGHARSCHGLDAAGRHVWMVSEGEAYNQGLKLSHCAELLKQYGAVTAFDSGGGGDAEIGMGVTLLTATENPGGVERALPQTLLLYAQEADMTLGRAKELLGKIPNIRSAPSISGADVGDIPAFSEITFEDIVDDREHPGDANYKWFLMSAGRYTAYKYPRSGGTPDRFTILSMPEEPPAGKHTVEVIVDGVTVYKTELT